MRKLHKKETYKAKTKWPIVGLESICNFEYGFSDIAKDRGSVRFIRITDIEQSGKIKEVNKKFIDISRSNIKYLLQKNDLLVARTGATFGKTAIFDKRYLAIFASYLIRLKFINSNILPKYYWFFSQSKAYWEQAYNLVKGGAQPQFNSNVIKKIEIPLPPLSEQKKIVDILSSWDSAIETTDKLISAKEKQFKWLLKKLITDQENNPNWKKEKLKEVAKIKKGQQLNKVTLNKSRGYPVQNGGVEPSGYTDKWNTKENTITISEGGNSCGFVKFNEQKFWSGGHCYSVIDLSNKLENKFLFYYFKNNEKKIMRLRVGSGLPNIQKKDIENFLIVYPDLKIQKKISDLLSYERKEIKILEEISNKYKEQKKGLMQKLFTGRIRL